MSRQNYVIKEAQVEYVEDGSEIYGEEYDAYRIKVRLSQDGEIPVKNLPWCHPFLPKMFQSIPKQGESVLVITSEIGNNSSNRYYIGPFLSQPQRFKYDPYLYGRGSAIDLLNGGDTSHVLKNILKSDTTIGSFPDKQDVAIIGRQSEDIALKEGEIMIRSGARVDAQDKQNDLIGDVIFNTNSPAYLQLKYKQGLINAPNMEANSVINIVADKINLISHKDENISDKLVDPYHMIDEKNFSEVMGKLHQLPYGDELVKILEVMKDAILTHGHNLSPGSKPIETSSIIRVKDAEPKSILSPNIRIN